MDQKRLVVIGGGMVAHRLVEAMRDRDADGAWRIDVFTEESRPPYDRVALTTFFSGRDPEDLLLGDPGLWRQEGVRLHTNSQVRRIDTEARQVHARGRVYDYDALVMATGSSAFVPPVEGADLPGSFVYRTVDDVAELRAWVEHREREHDRPVRGAVVGGGLLGLEAAGALQAMGVETTVVEFAPRLMALHVDRDVTRQGRSARSRRPDGVLRRREAAGRRGRLRHRRPAPRRAGPRRRDGRR
jgi:nitrite reductase (NADH) large subunit